MYYNKIVNGGKPDSNRNFSARLYLYFTQIKTLDNPTMLELVST